MRAPAFRRASQLLAIDRLDQIVVGAGLQACDDICPGALRRQQNHVGGRTAAGARESMRQTSGPSSPGSIQSSSASCGGSSASRARQRLAAVGREQRPRSPTTRAGLESSRAVTRRLQQLGRALEELLPSRRASPAARLISVSSAVKIPARTPSRSPSRARASSRCASSTAPWASKLPADPFKCVRGPIHRVAIALGDRRRRWSAMSFGQSSRNRRITSSSTPWLPPTRASSRLMTAG